MAALKYWVWLTTLPGLTDSSKMLLMEHFSSPEDIYYADEEALWQVDGLKKEQAALLGSKSLAAADRILSDCARKDIFIITMADALYPDRLRNIYQPPLLLYGKGAMPLFDEEAAVAVVGTRSCTPYGIKCAEKLGYELTQQGGMVVSGMAKGVDGAAMRGALRFGGFTCGVLGGGVDVVYPAENRRLYEDIAATGVLLSEYPPQTLPEAWHFPVRNRIISGLSVAAVVVEAPVKSGALITAENAMEQGRDVFAIPGPVDAPNSAGCHRLIREGAILATCAWDILGEYESRFPHKLRRAAPPMPPLPRLAGEPKLAAEKPKTNASRPEEAEVPALPCLTAEELAGLSDEQRTVLRALRTDAPLLTDQLAEDSGLPIQRVLPALTLLEISGWVAQNGARSFVRTVALPEE
jgi:DNA processing protein